MSLLWKKYKVMKEKSNGCQAKRYDKSPCGRPLYDAKYCIFHSNDIEGKKGKFEKAFWEEFKRQEKEDDIFDFTGFIFPEYISFNLQEFKRPLYLKNAEFQGKANFREAKFSDKADFSGAKFFNSAYFSGATFSNEASFLVATFSNLAFFDRAKFSNSAYFSVATFSNLAFFSGAKFSNSAYFSGATFSNETYFNSTEFSKIILTNTYFEDVKGLFENAIKEKRIFKIFKTIKYKIDDFRFILGPKAEAKYPIIAKKTRDAWFLANFKIQHPIIYFLWNLTSKCGQNLRRWLFIYIGLIILFGLIYSDYPCPSFLKWADWGNWMEKINPIITIGGKIENFTGFIPFYCSFLILTTFGIGSIIPLNFWGAVWITFELIIGIIMLGSIGGSFIMKILPGKN